jgi:site-specific DNA-cytosine methylase
MNVLDLFSGLGGWSASFKDRNHKVITLDIEPKFNPTICKNILDVTAQDLKKYGQFDIILASPPCNCFSVASIRYYWKNKRPNDKTKESIKLIGHTIKLILELYPSFWILENPRGMMRHVLGKPSVTTYYAAYGLPYLKPTDLWGVLPNIEWNKPKNG